MKQSIKSLADVWRLHDVFKEEHNADPTALYVGKREFFLLDRRLCLLLWEQASSGDWCYFCIGLPVFEVALDTHFEFVIGPRHALC